VPQNRRQTSGSERLNELRRTHPYDSTLQNLLAILTTKLDLCARLPIYEFEADNAGLADAASFFSALASAERESVHDLAQSLRVHLDRAQGRFAAADEASP
jgi:hypothetical protein